jgi:hypothetical protein
MSHHQGLSNSASQMLDDGSWRAEKCVGFDYNKGLITPF